jgi:hypothetical protein
LCCWGRRAAFVEVGEGPVKIIRKTFKSGERGPRTQSQFKSSVKGALSARDLSDHFDAVWLAINFLRDSVTAAVSTRTQLDMDAINTYLADKSYIQGYVFLCFTALLLLLFHDDLLFVSVFMKSLDYTT